VKTVIEIHTKYCVQNVCIIIFWKFDVWRGAGDMDVTITGWAMTKLDDFWTTNSEKGNTITSIKEPAVRQFPNIS